MALNERQRRFVAAYRIDPNGTKAAIAAGYSARTATAQASRLLRHPEVRAALEKGRSATEDATGITAAMVVSELARIGFAKITDLVAWRSNVREWGLEENGDGEQEVVFTITNQVEFKDSAALQPDVAAAIAEVSRSANGTIKIKMHNKVGALTKLGLHLGVFSPVDRPELPGKKELEQARAEGMTIGRFAPPDAPKTLQ